MDVAALVARVDEWTNQPESRERFYEQVRRYADLIEQRPAANEQHKAACVERVREVLRRGHLDERERPAAAHDRWTFRGYPVWAPSSPALARVRGRAEHPLTSRQEWAAAKALLAALDGGGNRGTAPYEVVCWLPPMPPAPSDPDHWAPSKQLAPETPLALRVPRLGEADALTVAYTALLSLRNRELGRPRLPEGLTPIQQSHMAVLADCHERHAGEMLRWVASDLEAAARAGAAQEVPGVRLARALNHLCTLGYNLNLFRQLAEKRERVGAGIRSLANQVGKADPAKAMEMMERPVEDRVAPEHMAWLRDQLSRWEAGCREAISALQAGGAARLDEALAPGTSKHALAAHVELTRATSIIHGFQLSLTSPALELEQHIAAWDGFIRWCGDTRDQLWAALALRTSQAPAAVAAPAPTIGANTRGTSEERAVAELVSQVPPTTNPPPMPPAALSTDGAKSQAYTLMYRTPVLTPTAAAAQHVYRIAQSLLSVVHLAVGESEYAQTLLDQLGGVLATQVPNLQARIPEVRSTARLLRLHDREPLRLGTVPCASAIEAVELLGVRLMTTFVGIHEPPLQQSEIREGLRRNCPAREELADLRVHLVREAEAVVAELSRPSVPLAASSGGGLAATVAANNALIAKGQQAALSNVVLLGNHFPLTPPNGGASPNEKGRPRRRKRTGADKLRDEATIAEYLSRHPDASRDEVARETKIAGGHVSGSKVWLLRQAERNKARRAARARGVGGVGDPTVDQPRDADEGD